MHQIWGKPKHTHTNQERRDKRVPFNRPPRTMCRVLFLEEEKTEIHLGPHQNTKYQSLLITKKKKPNFVRDQNLKVFIQMEWDLYVYIYTKNYQTEHSNQKRERSGCVRIKRNKPKVKRL